METQARHLAVGSFVLVLVAGLFVFVLWAAKFQGQAVYEAYHRALELAVKDVTRRFGRGLRYRRWRWRGSGCRRGRRTMHRMIHRLRRGGHSKGQRGDTREEKRDPGHSPSPFGRTLTTRIIPACIW